MRKTILAVSTSGGHWVQMMRLRSAFEGCNVIYATVDESAQADVKGERFYAIRDGGRNARLGLAISVAQLLLIVLRHRPDVVFSTGAAPGYFAIRIGKLFGAKTIWVDSMANAERISMTGQLVGKYADLWLTQWPHLSKEGGPDYAGSVV